MVLVMHRTKLLLVGSLALLAACPSDPGPCQPGDATFSTLTGAVSVQGGLDQTFDAAAPVGSAPCTIASRPSGDRDADLETRTTIDLQCESAGAHLSLTFEIDDTRRLGAGGHALDTGEYGLRISYRPSPSAPECYTYLPDTAYQLTLAEATGGFASYPELVTPDFHQRIEVALDLALAGRPAKQYTNGVVEPCALDFAGAFDFTAVLDAADYHARGVDTCVLE